LHRLASDGVVVFKESAIVEPPWGLAVVRSGRRLQPLVGPLHDNTDANA
jgi:hypothetical protein